MDFGLEQYDHIADLARSIKGKMIISVNDIPEMRKAFSGLTIDTTEITYTVGGADRSARRSELIIRKAMSSLIVGHCKQTQIIIDKQVINQKTNN